MTSDNDSTPRSGRYRAKDTQLLFAVRYADGRSAYIRVDPKLGEYGSAPVLRVAKSRQATGEIPDGDIVGVQKVK